jgi:hypothetical protein
MWSLFGVGITDGSKGLRTLRYLPLGAANPGLFPPPLTAHLQMNPNAEISPSRSFRPSPDSVAGACAGLAGALFVARPARLGGQNEASAEVRAVSGGVRACIC